MQRQKTLQHYVSLSQNPYNLNANVRSIGQALTPCAPSPSPRPSSVNELGLSRRNSIVNRSTSSLARRRSLLVTPGLATRNSPVENIRRTWSSWRTPRMDAQEEAKWKRHDAVENSPLARTTALSVAEERQEPSTPRAQTPSDMEYSHIGTLKLGSLKIANGEPSPAAASARLKWHASQGTSQEEDYFFSDSLESPIMMKSTRKRRHFRSKSALQHPNPPLYHNVRVSNDARRAKTTSRYGTLPKLDAPRQSRQQQRQPYHLDHEELDSEPEPVRRLRVMNKSQETVATMLEPQPDTCDDPSKLPQSVPFEDSDEGFVSDEDASPRNKTTQALDGTIFCEPIEAPSPQEHIVPHTCSTQKGPRRVKSRPPPAKADSGYSSGGSFTSKPDETQKPGTIPTVSRKPSMATNLRKSEDGTKKSDPPSLYMFEQMPQSPSSHESVPSAPTDKHAMSFDIHRHPSHEDMKSTSLPLDWNIDDLSLGSKAPKPPSTPTSFISHLSLDTKASAQRRLQKRVSSSQELPVVQSCDPIPEGSIPRVPKDIRKQFVRRLSETPGMECLTHTYPTKNHVNLDDPELETELPFLEPIKFPSPPATPEPESRGRHHERAGKERSSSLHRLRRSLSLFRRKTRNDEEEEQPPLPDQPIVFDLGTATASLGSSPYDTALATAHQKRDSSPAHPHQLGNAMPRVRSMVNMDAETAAKLARVRSKDRGSQRPGMPPRPKSYYSEKEAIGDANIYRRHSFYGHAPPMPTIPSVGDFHAVSSQCEPKTLIQPEAPQVPEPNEANSGRRIRARSTGRGRVVTPLIEKFDQYGQRPHDAERRSRSSTIDNDTTYCAAIRESHSYTQAHEPVSRRHKKKINHPDWG
jgi:hypothetical protein